MSACMSGTRGSGVFYNTGDVLVRGVGGVCDMCLGRGGEEDEWIRELGLGFTNPVECWTRVCVLVAVVWVV